MKYIACIQFLSVVWSIDASVIADDNNNGHVSSVEGIEHKAGNLRRGTLAYEDVMGLNLLLDNTGEKNVNQPTTSLLCTPTEDVVYTAVTYTGTDFTFDDTEALVSLESNFGAAYNNEVDCAADSDAYQTVGTSFIFGTDVAAKNYLLGSRLRFNSVLVQKFCGSSDGSATISKLSSQLSSQLSVPALYSEDATAATANNTVTASMTGQCVCDGPQEKDFVSSYNELLKADAATINSSNTSIATVTQLCVSPTCKEEASEITYNVTEGFVYLPCENIMFQSVRDPTRSPTRSPSRRPTRRPTRRPSKAPTPEPTPERKLFSTVVVVSLYLCCRCCFLFLMLCCC